MKKMNKTITISIILFLTSCCVHFITPVESTVSAITANFVRIGLFAEKHKKMPVSLEELPNREGYDERITDGWNRPLKYVIDSNGIVTITSFGRDGKPGGVGEDADISKSYRSRRPDGSLWAASPMWIVEAEVKCISGLKAAR